MGNNIKPDGKLGFHGHVREWQNLDHDMQKALIKNNIVDSKGNPTRDYIKELENAKKNK